MPQSKVLTFESWVTESEWFGYAKAHPDDIPYLLSDRSQCQDPFFDLFATNVRDRQPMITGLCRGFRNFKKGDRYIYVTRLCSEAARERRLDWDQRPWYLGVASLMVTNIEDSHEQAARRFSQRRYVAIPTQTPYPPGLAHDVEPTAAVLRDSCIVHVEFTGCGSASKAVGAHAVAVNTGAMAQAVLGLPHQTGGQTASSSVLHVRINRGASGSCHAVARGSCAPPN